VPLIFFGLTSTKSAAFIVYLRSNQTSIDGEESTPKVENLNSESHGYAANLKRELPRIPFAPDFRAFADIGKRLAEIHVNYEQQPEYPLERIEKPGAQLDWRVERMKLSKDKRSLIYNDFLTLSGIPPEVFEYRLGNRSALEWIVDQYQVSTDKRSSITNDPNRADDPQYIVRLIGQVILVSMETVKLVQSLSTKPLLPETS
jgi:predicted helicase